MTDLDAAYRATRYHADDGGRRLTVRIGERSPDFDALLRREGVRTGVFITGWNPLSIATPPDQNRRAAERLAQDVTALGLRALPHNGEGDDPRWPAEEGLFVLGLARDDAVSLAERYRQNAFVIVSLGAPAELVATRWMAVARDREAPLGYSVEELRARRDERVASGAPPAGPETLERLESRHLTRPTAPDSENC